MKVEKALITINQESLDYGVIPLRTILFVDCEFNIEDFPEETLVFMNCYFKNCRFNSLTGVFELADRVLGGSARNCTFGEEAAQGVTDAPSS